MARRSARTKSSAMPSSGRRRLAWARASAQAKASERRRGHRIDAGARHGGGQPAMSFRACGAEAPRRRRERLDRALERSGVNRRFSRCVTCSWRFVPVHDVDPRRSHLGRHLDRHRARVRAQAVAEGRVGDEHVERRVEDGRAEPRAVQARHAHLRVDHGDAGRRERQSDRGPIAAIHVPQAGRRLHRRAVRTPTDCTRRPRRGRPQRSSKARCCRVSTWG